GSEEAATRKLWIYDLRTNMHFTLKTSALKRSDLDEFVACFYGIKVGEAQQLFSWDKAKQAQPLTAGLSRHNRKPTWAATNPDGRWRAYEYQELIARDKASLDIFWLKDESLEDSDNLPEPGILAQQIVDDLEAALSQFRLIAEDLGPGNGA
ncbi:MAG: hypothetical protein HZB24_15395, partial [Desulfobacterales bacterium]|nr:hypothetical protein [Desulfobacterales bacterium]